MWVGANERPSMLVMPDAPPIEEIPSSLFYLTLKIFFAYFVFTATRFLSFSYPYILGLYRSGLLY